VPAGAPRARAHPGIDRGPWPAGAAGAVGRERVGHRPPVGIRMDEPGLADVLAARGRIAPHLTRTPFRPYPALAAAVGADVRVKHENHNPTAAFKVRGGINLVSQLTQEEREHGLVTAST